MNQLNRWVRVRRREATAWDWRENTGMVFGSVKGKVARRKGFLGAWLKEFHSKKHADHEEKK
ncbi:hypothetical protein [Desulfonatronum thiodismutans]|uniref:hypothetical protein n=1 Tax=Desulfonatronum thiodismutans TaxID=159290 RepID=UPI00137693D3|nr:hypothetical protein [Desulfonatronum thiodismutans]